MKKTISLLLAITMMLSLCACGNSTTTPKGEAVLSKQNGTVAQETESAKAQDSRYAESLFSFEGVAYQKSSMGISFVLKFRNQMEQEFDSLYFKAQSLDGNGEVLESSGCGTQAMPEKGQSTWFFCKQEIFDECAAIEEAATKADSIRITAVVITPDKDDSSTRYTVEFKEPIIIKVADVQPKE